jgi:hypothetical protein
MSDWDLDQLYNEECAKYNERLQIDILKADNDMLKEAYGILLEKYNREHYLRVKYELDLKSSGLL